MNCKKTVAGIVDGVAATAGHGAGGAGEESAAHATHAAATSVTVPVPAKSIINSQWRWCGRPCSVHATARRGPKPGGICWPQSKSLTARLDTTHIDPPACSTRIQYDPHQHTITTRHSCNARRRRGLSTVQPQSHLFNITAPR